MLSEAVQSVMRALAVQGVPRTENPYERLRDLTQDKRVSGEGIRIFVDGLGLPETARERLLALNPHSCTGYATMLVDHLEGGVLT